LLLFIVLGTGIVAGQETLEKRIEISRNRWYDKQYSALQERPLGALSPTASDHESYRFTWLRTFHHPVVVRIEIDGEQAQVFVKETDGAGGYDPGTLIRNIQFDLTASNLAKLRQALNQSKFWQEPRYENSDVVKSDGARWIFDGCKRDGCHVVDRWSPGKKTSFGRLGKFFLSLSKTKFAEAY
jgi:hypothetical protein